MINGEKSRDILNAYLEKKLSGITKPSDRRTLYRQISDRFNISPAVISDMVCFRKDIREFNNFEVFAVLYFVSNESLKRYFTENEISKYSNEKHELPITESLPITLDGMVQICEDQWIGKTTVQMLMRLKRSRMINYDENEQRIYKIIKSNDGVSKRIWINSNSVASIKEALERDKYIPDVITLNMPLDGSEYMYDSESRTLKISALPNGMFNLIDGYHRYIAMSQIHNFNESFDYPLELRVVNYSTEKAEQFIWQNDQKTRMKKVDSDTYDQFSLCNRIIQRINQDPASNIQGMIGRRDSAISMQELSMLIKHYYLKERISKKDENKAVIEVKNKLENRFNYLTEYFPEYLDKVYSGRELFIVMHCFAKEDNNELCCAKIKYLLKHTENVDPGLFDLTNSVRRKTVNLLDKLLEDFSDAS